MPPAWLAWFCCLASQAVTEGAVRVAVLSTGHCDRTHPCGSASWESTAVHVVEPLARLATIRLFLCTGNVTAAYNDGFERTARRKAPRGRLAFQRVDVFNEGFHADISKQLQFVHRHQCYGAAEAVAARTRKPFDWYVQIRPDLVFFTPLVPSSGGWPFESNTLYTRVFNLETRCSYTSTLDAWRLTRAHLSRGWWDPCRDAVKVVAGRGGVIKAKFDDQLAVVAGNVSRRYYAGMLQSRAGWKQHYERFGSLVPNAKDPIKTDPESFYTWGVLHEQIRWQPIAVEVRLARLVRGAGCQICTIRFGPETDTRDRAERCGCSRPRPDSAELLNCGTARCAATTPMRVQEERFPAQLSQQEKRRESPPRHAVMSVKPFFYRLASAFFSAKPSARA